MKVLLKFYDGEEYVWRNAKHNGVAFVVDGVSVEEKQIISVMNDNRKNYVRCSSCGKIFPKNGKKFLRHQMNAASIDTCMKCDRLRANETGEEIRKYSVNADGSYTMQTKCRVELVCRYGLWNHFYIDSDEALHSCKFRKCGDANALSIEDTFTRYPGVFDDIITIDKILDNGYDEALYLTKDYAKYLLDSNLDIIANINSIGIVTSFEIDINGINVEVMYSKRYKQIFEMIDGKYEEFSWTIDQDRYDAILKYLAKLYK